MLRLTVLSTLIAAGLVRADAPEPLKGTERTTYDSMRILTMPVDDNGRKILAKHAKFVVGQLMDQTRQTRNDLAQEIETAIREMIPWRNLKPKTFQQAQLDYNHEIGKAFLAELPAALRSGKPVARMNAARLLSIVGEIGCEGAAAEALKLLQDKEFMAKAKESEFWLLHTLTNTFAFEENATLKDKSCFTDRGLEHRCIQFLCNYVLMPREVSKMQPEEINAIRYIRREAVRALGFVRQCRVMFNGEVLARPGLVLLKVANRDRTMIGPDNKEQPILIPEPDMKERAIAIVGFCNLFPIVARADRGVNCDYVAFMLGNALLDLATVKLNVPGDISIPWKDTAEWIEDGLATLEKNTTGMGMPGAAAIKSMNATIKADILGPLKNPNPANPPNVGDFRQWLQGNAPKAKSLFENEPTATVKPASPG